MKKYLLLLILSGSVTFLHAQCEILNKSFEDWSTQTVGGDGITTTDVLLPDAMIPAVRFLFWSFTGPQISDSILMADPIGFIGLEQSTDATDGSFAVKLQAAHTFYNGVTDLSNFGACTDPPDSVAVDIKHVGELGDDYIAMAALFDQGVPSLNAEFLDIPYVAESEDIEMVENGVYARYVLPIVENFESEVDSFYFLVVAETTDSTYYLIDNVAFIYNEPSSTSDTEISNAIELTQNPVYENLSLTIQEPINVPVDLIITDVHGKMYMRDSYQALQTNLEIEVSDFPSGSYYLQIRTREGISTLKFIKI